MPTRSIDHFDAKLLSLLQSNNRLNSGELGERIGLSATAVQRRLKRLRQEGIIEADVSIVAPHSVGKLITMIVLVTLERERLDIIDRFKQSMRQTIEVMAGYYVTGDADFLLIVTAESMEDYETFTRRFFYENPDIRGFKTLVVMDRVKAGFVIPIDANRFK